MKSYNSKRGLSNKSHYKRSDKNSDRRSDKRHSKHSDKRHRKHSDKRHSDEHSNHSDKHHSDHTKLKIHKCHPRCECHGKNIIQVLSGLPEFSTFYSFLVKTKLNLLIESLSEPTVFAPTNKSFSKLSSSVLNQLKTDTELLTKVLLYHIVNYQVSPLHLNYLSPLKLQTELKLSNKTQTIKVDSCHPKQCCHTVSSITLTTTAGQSVRIKEAIKPKNGYVHAVNKVMLYRPLY